MQKGLSVFFETYLDKEPLFVDKKPLQVNFTPDIISCDALNSKSLRPHDGRNLSTLRFGDFPFFVVLKNNPLGFTGARTGIWEINCSSGVGKLGL